MADSSNPADAGPVEIKVTSGGQALLDDVQVYSVEVNYAVGRVPYATLLIGDGIMTTASWPIADSDSFQPGSKIVIAAGYGTASDTIFSGIVVRLGARFTEDNVSRIEVFCQDEAIGMTFGRHNAISIDKTDSDIISGLITDNGLTGDVEATSLSHRELVQYYCSDWDFMMMRAEANGLVVIVNDGTVSVKSPAVGGEAAVEATWGLDLFEFQANLDARDQVATVNAVAWDPKNQAVVEASAQAKSLNSQGNLDSSRLSDLLSKTPLTLQSATMLEQAALTAWAEAQQVKSGLARISGRLTIQGTARLTIGTVMKVSGVGARFNGNVYVGGVNHQIEEGEWRTRAEFGLPSRWFIERADVVAPSAAGWVPGAAGLQIGIVTKLAEDPAGEQRVQVELPLLKAEGKQVWARLLQYYASSGFGAFYLPEIGDEVVIGYFNDDPANPVILGSLYSSNRAPPYAFAAENNIKALVTRSKARIEIDDENSIITIKTAAENKAVFDDKDKSILLQDQHGNSIKMSQDGIALDSIKDITISAKGNINATAVQAIGLTATTDLTAKGLNATVEANASLTCKGTASAELSAAGQTTVRGAIVMIN